MSNYQQSTKSSPSRDALIATNIVKKLFQHINLCIQSDRSKVRLNMFEKGAIKGLLSGKTLNGINDYVNNMYSNDISRLLDDIEAEIKKRRQ